MTTRAPYMFWGLRKATGALLIASGAASAQDLVLTNARLVDVERGLERRGSVWIRAGLIAGTGASAPHDAPGRRIDVGGRWVIPGFYDLHTHSWGNSGPGGVFDAGGTAETAVRVLTAGVVGFLDLFANEDSIFQLRDSLRALPVRGAAVFAAGACLTATRGHCSEFGVPTRIIDSPADARLAVRALARRRADVIKVVYDHRPPGGFSMPSITYETLEGLVREARVQGVRVVAHVGSWDDAWDAARAGVEAITHTPEDAIVPDSVVAMLVRHRVKQIPTLVVHTEFATMVDSVQRRADPLLRRLTTAELLASYAPGVADSAPRLRARLDAERRARPRVLASVRRLYRAGVEILVGTDAANPGAFQGFSVHREMELLVAAGLSPADALAAASTRAAAFLGRRSGLRPGDLADLVILDASPLVRIENSKRIHAVIRNGELRQ